MVFLSSELWFPDPKHTDESGIVAVGGDLSSERLVLAYRNGIFPWYNVDEPILWWCPDRRMVLFPHQLHISKSMKPLLKKEKFKVTYNQEFKTVINECATMKRKGQEGTWLTDEMVNAYMNLHEMGLAKSFEVWENNNLVGGLYGIYLQEKNIFCGESMYSKKSNASKFGFIKMVEHYKSKGVKLIDCQMHTEHLERFGAHLIERDAFLSYL